MNNRLTILGKGASWSKCPFDGTETWAAATCLVTPGMTDKHYDKVFAVDSGEIQIVKDCIAIAKERGIPLVSTKSYATEPYPLHEVSQDFQSTYLHNTVSYMLALAVHQGYSKLMLYGVDQEDAGYSCLKPAVILWLGIATGRGIQCTVNGSDVSRYVWKMVRDITEGRLATGQEEPKK